MPEDVAPSSTLGFAEEAAVFKGPTQNARVLSEGWVTANGFCPSCGAAPLTAFAANSPVADFHCGVCAEEYELKATKGRTDAKLVNGSWGAMKARLAAANNPSLMVMGYDKARTRVIDLIVVPKHFFTEAIIEPRKPLSITARRAGWQGCNILIGQVPLAGRIALIRSGSHIAKQAVLDQWRATLFLREASLAARGWLLDVMKCVEEIGRPEFTLADVYAYEARLAAVYPANNNVRPKIRQQLQMLRDMGWLEFTDRRGLYRRTT
ncbi:MAG: restriction endonuclease [Alphaproteobacteria bacterium]|nr:MAG: restriction endonuclease [Alphaproteobacteria bacterium]